MAALRLEHADLAIVVVGGLACLGAGQGRGVGAALAVVLADLHHLLFSLDPLELDEDED